MPSGCRAARAPEHEAFAIRGVKFLDDRIANPAYGLLLLTGLLMVFLSRIPLTTFWIAAALVLWLIAMVSGLALYTPALRRQLEALEASGSQSDAYRALDRRSSAYGIAIAVVVLLILVLMVFKPGA